MVIFYGRTRLTSGIPVVPKTVIALPFEVASPCVKSSSPMLVSVVKRDDWLHRCADG